MTREGMGQSQMGSLTEVIEKQIKRRLKILVFLI